MTGQKIHETVLECSKKCVSVIEGKLSLQSEVSDVSVSPTSNLSPRVENSRVEAGCFSRDQGRDLNDMPLRWLGDSLDGGSSLEKPRLAWLQKGSELFKKDTCPK